MNKKLDYNESIIDRCFVLANNGLGTTYPNPLVGAVITYEDNIIGEGWHLQSGLPHAEINAIRSVKNKELLKNSVLYVSLEPCSFVGKTPACSKTIIDYNIPKVVIGSIDPHEKVAGKGIEMLRENGVEVIIVDEKIQKKFNLLNKRFFCFHQKKRPYIFLKWAQSSNLKLDNGDKNRKTPFWVSNKYTKQWAHKRRTEEMAIMVGRKTAIQDNPELTARLWFGENPIRVTIDKNLVIPLTSNIFNNEAKTIIFNKIKEEEIGNLAYVKINFNDSVENQILQKLHKFQIQSIIIEGGSITLQSFIDRDLWDEIEVINSNIGIKSGTFAPKFDGKLIYHEKIDDNILNIYRNWQNE